MKRILGIWLLFSVITSNAWGAPGDLARAIVDETNLARTEPRRYAGFVRAFRGRFIGKAYRIPGTATLVMTSEGVSAVDEAIKFLSAQRPLPALDWSPGLARAAAALVREQSDSGAVGHGNEGGDMRRRVEKQGRWQGSIGENISYGPDTARQVVIGLIVDDGVPDRGHRKNIFNPSFKTAGAACGTHPVFRTICVTDFAGGFKGRE